jgi:hypothetical protein
MEGWFCFVLILVLAGWGLDRHLRLRDIEIELKEHLGDLLVSRDASLDKTCRCCAQSRVLQFKALIRRHFKL